MAVMGKARPLPKVDTPKDKKILVDVEAYHPLLVRACYNKSMKFNPVSFVKNSLLQKFSGLDVEFFFDGDDLDMAEARIRKMEELATSGHGIKKSDYKFVQQTLRSSTPITHEFKHAVVQACSQKEPSFSSTLERRIS
ncbi:hypothetical protein BGX28_001531 [Mortierella sp. GBA30]|nr:hypothetical protein BGX28_001531 [Mortierella sp. GBA30]